MDDLNVSRGLGDYDYKWPPEFDARDQVVTGLCPCLRLLMKAFPDVQMHELDNTDDAIILATDGVIWYRNC